MTIVNGKGENGGAERESRFVHLLQPNRDMATNWCVDVGKQLEGYLEELKATGLFDDGECSLNFAEAALLIQGSTQVYSRKVEYLYNLVLRALDFLAQKKQEEATSSQQEDGQDRSPAQEEEENFLNLDDLIREEADIDFLDQEGVGPRTPPMKIPACLRVTEADSNEMSGDAAELASYNVATCTMYRNFMLLDPTDSEAVDKYYEDDEIRKQERDEASGAENSTTPGPKAQTAPRSFDTPASRGAGTPPAADNNAMTTPAGMDTFEADWQGNADEGMWDDPQADEQFNEGPKDPATADGGEKMTGRELPVENENYIDPWEPLNPYDSGTLSIKPFMKGKTQRKAKSGKDCSMRISIARRKGVCFPEFTKALQAKERQERAMNRATESSRFDNLRKSFFKISEGEDAANDDGLGGSSGDSDSDDNYWGGECMAAGFGNDNSSGGNAPSVDPPQQPQVVFSDGYDRDAFATHEDCSGFDHGFEGSQNMSLEDLCRAHVDSVMQKLADSQVRSGLTARVTSWKNKIEGTLKADESRPPFDIHEYGDRLLATLATKTATKRSYSGEDLHETFTDLVHGQEKDQVARSFSALLQLVNNGNVMIDKGNIGNRSYCFTAINSFRVQLLNPQNFHDGMFQHLAPPTQASRGSGRKRVQQQTPTNQPGQSQRVRTPVMISERSSPVLALRTPRSGLRLGGNKSTVFISPCSVRKKGRKCGQSIGINATMNFENMAISTPDKDYTPVKLTPNRRQTKRKPLQTIQV